MSEMGEKSCFFKMLLFLKYNVIERSSIVANVLPSWRSKQRTEGQVSKNTGK